MKKRHIFAGFAAGLFSGLLGVGGGIILIPLLVQVFKIDQKKAQGTTLIFIIPIAFIASIQYRMAGNLQLTNVLWTAIGSMGGIYLGSMLAYKSKSEILMKGFGVLMVLISIKLFLGI